MVDDIAKKRWEKQTEPKNHPPEMAPKMFLEAIASGELDIDSIDWVGVIYHTKPTENHANGYIGYYQAGGKSYYESLGFMDMAKQVMRDL